MVKKRGLNRGLQALLQGAGSLDMDLDQTTWEPTEELKHLPVEWLQRGIYQPRRDLASYESWMPISKQQELSHWSPARRGLVEQQMPS